MRSFVACVVLMIFAVAANAAEFDWFPSTAETIGANLPTADLSHFNKRLAREVIDRFDFKSEVQSDVRGKIRGKLLDFSGLSCKGAFSNLNDFMREVIVEGRFEGKLIALLGKSNLEQRALEYLMYGPSFDDQTYDELRSIPVNALTKKFVELWLANDYLSSKAVQATMKRIATHIWESECGEN